jgi:hypothetical protein
MKKKSIFLLMILFCTVRPMMQEMTDEEIAQWQQAQKEQDQQKTKEADQKKELGFLDKVKGMIVQSKK